MLKIILVMLAGMGLGFLLRKVSFISYINRTISWTIFLMLFLLGVSVGSNPAVIGNLSTLGLQALLLAFAGTLGSLLAGWWIYKRFFEGRDSILAMAGSTSAGKADTDTGSTDNPDTGTLPEPGGSPAGRRTQRHGKWRRRVVKVIDSVIVIAFFIAGTVFGATGVIGNGIIGENTVLAALYCLMLQVGISLGHDTTLKKALKDMKPEVLLVPLGTIVGTLSLSAVAGLVLSRWSVANCLAASSGFAYYSLSSVLISEYASESLGAQLAAELGTIALLTNIFREISCLLFTPLYVRWFDKIAPICAAGVTSVDVTLPVIIRNCGKEYMPVAIVQGVITDFSVPFLVSFFCSFP